MSTTDNQGGPAERDEDFLAAEYALGVLDAAGRRRAEARLADDPAFAREVAAFEAHLMPLAGEVAAVPAPAAVWTRLEAALASPAPRYGVAASARAGLWQSLAFWRGFGVAAAGLAVASLVAIAVIASQPSAPAPSAPMLAALNEAGGASRLMVTVDRSQGTIMVMPVGMTMPAAHVPELWLIPPGGAPHALGMVDAQKPMKMKIPHEMMPDMSPGAMLAVSVEPPGGSPTGKPTGPVVASGKLYVL